MINNQNNLIYFSGPHGSGKTSLIKVLAGYDNRVMVPELYSRNLKFHTDAMYRKLLKTAGRAVENFEYLQIAKDNPEKIIIGNRCIYDVLAYDRVYEARGWIDQETFNMLKLTKAFFRDGNEEPYAVIINPGFDTTWKHLHTRWNDCEKKWKEEDIEYCRLACRSYEQFKGSDKILYIDKELNLESRLELDPILKWMTSRRQNVHVERVQEAASIIREQEAASVKESMKEVA